MFGFAIVIKKDRKQDNKIVLVVANIKLMFFYGFNVFLKESIKILRIFHYWKLKKLFEYLDRIIDQKSQKYNFRKTENDEIFNFKKKTEN